jgi:protein RecA
MDALEAGIGANDTEQKVTQWIDTGDFELNEIMSGIREGGLPVGRMVEMFGESSSGKTALATQWMVETQRMGGVAIFIDWERSFNVELAEHFGLRTDERWVYRRPRTWEEGNMIATAACRLIREKRLIPDDKPILVVYDSIASAVPKSQSEKNLDELTMNDTTALARVTSTTLKTQAQFAADYNACYLYLNQVRLKPGVVYGDPRTTPGGKAMEFYASARLALGREKIVEDKEFIGQAIGVECVKSKFTKPFQKTKLRMSFNDADIAYFDHTTTLVERCIDNGKLEYKKPRVTWIDGKQYFRKALVEKIEAEGLQAELKKIAMS